MDNTYSIHCASANTAEEGWSSLLSGHLYMHASTVFCLQQHAFQIEKFREYLLKEGAHGKQQKGTCYMLNVVCTAIHRVMVKKRCV